MSILNIKTFPASVLKKQAGEIDEIDGNLQKLIDDMVETMYTASGIGLAAPQIGMSKTLTVVDISAMEKNNRLIVMINPKIVYTEGEIMSEEGCLSVPEFMATLKRHQRIFVRYFDREGNQGELEAGGLLARAVQHEIDHLNGVLFIDRLDAANKEIFKKSYLKKVRKKR